MPSPRSHAQTTARSALRRSSSVAADVLLWILAAAGALCMVLVALVTLAGVSLIMFRTGSMSPAIPAGSVAVVQQVPASSIRVGDVVTVDRAEELPITHRVTSVLPGENGEQRIITMRGDANAQDDPAPYRVDDVRIVRFAVPGLAPAIVALGSPATLAAITAGVAALVLWVFWPRRRRDAAGMRPAAHGRSRRCR